MKEIEFNLLKEIGKAKTMEREEMNDYCNRIGLDDFALRKSIAVLLKHQLIVHVGVGAFNLTGLGIEVTMFNNWEEYVNKDQRIRRYKDVRLKYSSLLAKWQYYVFWPAFIFGVTGFILSIYNASKRTTTQKDIEELKVSILQVEEELYRLRISTSDQKNPDSLRNSKESTVHENNKTERNK